MPKPFLFGTLIALLSSNWFHHLHWIQLRYVHVSTFDLDFSGLVPTLLAVKLHNVEVIWLTTGTKVRSFAQTVLVLVSDQTFQMEHTMIWTLCDDVGFLLVFPFTEFAYLLLNSLRFCFAWNIIPFYRWCGVELFSSHLCLVRICRSIGEVGVLFLVFLPVFFIFLSLSFFLLSSLLFLLKPGFFFFFKCFFEKVKECKDEEATKENHTEIFKEFNGSIIIWVCKVLFSWLLDLILLIFFTFETKEAADKADSNTDDGDDDEEGYWSDGYIALIGVCWGRWCWCNSLRVDMMGIIVKCTDLVMVFGSKG